MKVWTYPEKKYEDFGAIRWQVSWEEVAAHAKGKDEIDYDEDIIYRFANCNTKEVAMREARKIVDGYRTAFGSATVTRQVVDWFVEEDRIAEWVNTGDEEIID